jgi:N-acetylmuramoyl-L-alanine amidase
LKQDLYVGVEGASSDVSSLQKYLSAIGDFSYSATGFFGLRTESAVKKFQGDQGISSTGYAGPITRAKIATLTCAN